MSSPECLLGLGIWLGRQGKLGCACGMAHDACMRPPACRCSLASARTTLLRGQQRGTAWRGTRACTCTPWQMRNMHSVDSKPLGQPQHAFVCGCGRAHAHAAHHVIQPCAPPPSTLLCGQLAQKSISGRSDDALCASRAGRLAMRQGSVFAARNVGVCQPGTAPETEPMQSGGHALHRCLVPSALA